MGGLPALVGASTSRDGQAVSGTPLEHVARKCRVNHKKVARTIYWPTAVKERHVPQEKTVLTPFCFAAALLLTVSGGVEAQIEIEAISGEPFGVGRMSVRLSDDLLPEPLGPEGLSLSEKSGRVVYPAIKTPSPVGRIVKDLLGQAPGAAGRLLDPRRPVGRLLDPRRPAGQLLGQLLDQAPKTTVYFLFRGQEPLEMTIQARRLRAATVVPRRDPRNHRKWLEAWWRQYTFEPGLLAKKVDYPPLVENYLKSMLARRMGLALPDKSSHKSWQAQLGEELGLMLGSEEVRLAMERDRMLGLLSLDQPADQPVPEPIDPPKLEVPEPAADVKVEPIALHVPAECLYVRFGSFTNFLWIQDTMKKWGGDMRNLVALRGLDQSMSKRMEQQLVLKQTVLARMFGDTVIADVAIIGTDLFMQEGGAFGILFHARNTAFLGSDFARQRSTRLKQGDGVTEKKINIASKEVSFLSSPDGAVRSFYAVDGDFHFITTSATLARRFLEVGSGNSSLGASKEFRHARTVMPLERNDTVFAYFSDTFFRNITGPRYRTEIIRRLQALADLELAQLALLTSATEGMPGEEIEDLIAGGFLPPEFGPRPDGSRTVLEDGEVKDSLRGHRGRFAPVPDVKFDSLTRWEVEAYRQFAEFYRSKWGRMDPMMVAIKRQGLPENREYVVIDAVANPFARKHYDMLAERLGPADKMRLAPIPGDMAAGEVVLSNQRLFGGLRDFGLPLTVVDGRPLLTRRLRDMLVGYVGTTGELGLLSLLNLRITGPADAAGYAGAEGQMWRRQYEHFTVFSFQRDVLATVVPQLRFQPAERPAQFRLHVGDVSNAQITPVVNSMGYSRTRDTSLGNVRLMHTLKEQLHVPDPDCRAAAELLLDARLICPLGGEYVYREIPGGGGYWTSTALEGSDLKGGLFDTRVPDGFVSPPLDWFRGLDVDATMTEKALSAHVELVMQLPEAKPERPEPEPTKPAQPDDKGETKPKASSWLDTILSPGKKAKEPVEEPKQPQKEEEREEAKPKAEKEEPKKKPAGWLDRLLPGAKQ